MREERFERWVAWCVFLSTSLVYVLTTSSHPFWLDSAEFVTMASQGGVAHPPGAPFYLILANLFSWVPFGSMAFRINLFSAVLGAANAVLLYRIGLVLLRRVEYHDRWGKVASAAVAMAVALTPALWFQSVRAEVYTLNSATNLMLVYLSLRWSEEPQLRRWGLLAALTAGLGLCNHHFLTLLVVLCCGIYLLTIDGVRKSLLFKNLGLFLCALFVGLLTYIYLPIRAPDSWMLWGDPTTPGGFWNIVSAQAFHGSTDASRRLPFLDAATAILVKWIGLMSPVFVTAGFAGLVAFVYQARKQAVLLGLLVLAGVLSKAVMYLDTENPDDHAYYTIGIQALAASSLGLVPLVRRLLARLADSRPAFAARLVAAVVMVVPLSSAALVAPGALERWTLRSFPAPDAFHRHLVAQLPPSTVYMPAYYPLFFNELYFDRVEHRRPDVGIIWQGFQAKYQGGRSYVQELAEKDNELAGIAGEYLASGLFPVAALQELASTRQVIFEADVTSVAGKRYQEFALDPRGGLPFPLDQLGFVGPGARIGTVSQAEALQAQRKFWMGLYKDISGYMPHPEVAKILLYMHYRNALFFVNSQAWTSARLELRIATRILEFMDPRQSADRFEQMDVLLAEDESVAISTTPGSRCQSLTSPDAPDPEMDDLIEEFGPAPFME